MAKLIVNLGKKKSQINKNIYGHFSEHLGRCIYEGLFVGEESTIPHVNGMRQDVVQALRHIKIPVLRWPGGCFADEYHWKDGIGVKENRKRMINTHWGGVVEDNSFGTHEFMELCRQLECEPYINGNLGSGSVQEMSEWVEYLTFSGVSPMAELRTTNGQENPWMVKYFGVGNENWGCGGNMRPEYYADEYRRYQTYVRNYGTNKLFKIACGSSGEDLHWTKVLMEQAGRYMDGLTLHYYTLPFDWSAKGSATEFDLDVYYQTIKKTFRMEYLLEKHSQIMDTYDPEKRVALIVDEWGSWYDVEPGTNPGFLYQQNTMRDAIIAAVNLNLFNKHSDRVRMANIAQTVNVLQSVILTEGSKMVLTPTYHVFDLYKVHQDATLLDSYITAELIGTEQNQVVDLHESASIDAEGRIHITLCNIDALNEKSLEGLLLGFSGSKVTGQLVQGEIAAFNTFEQPNTVFIQEFKEVVLSGDSFTATLPPCSVVQLTFE
jgi:alpha-L-arabinofuranosidase